ncbi:hypothetical protein D3C85_783300 [compost metagenome]
MLGHVQLAHAVTFDTGVTHGNVLASVRKEKSTAAGGNWPIDGRMAASVGHWGRPGPGGAGRAAVARPGPGTGCANARATSGRRRYPATREKRFARRSRPHQVTSFGEVMLDQARLVRLKGTANPATQPAPVFQVGQIVEDGFHEHHRLDNDIHYYLIMTINTIAKPDQDFAKRFFYGPLND